MVLNKKSTTVLKDRFKVELTSLVDVTLMDNSVYFTGTLDG